MKNKENNELYIKCDCGSEIINLAKDPDLNEFYLSIYRYKYLKPGLKHRLHHCWHILKTGSPYEDEIIINEKTAKEIIKFLNKNIK